LHLLVSLQVCGLCIIGLPALSKKAHHSHSWQSFTSLGFSSIPGLLKHPRASQASHLGNWHLFIFQAGH